MQDHYKAQKIRALLNGQIRQRLSYTMDNVAAIWHVESCKGVQLPECRGGIYYPQGKTQKLIQLIVFVLDTKYINWAEDNNLIVKAKWVNENHTPYIESTTPKIHYPPKKQGPRAGRNQTYEDVYDRLSILVDDLTPIYIIAETLHLGPGKTTAFRHRYRIEKAQAQAKKALTDVKKRVKVNDK